MKISTFFYFIAFLVTVSVLGFIYSRDFISKTVFRGLIQRGDEQDSCVKDTKKYAKLKFFVLFIGYARSGSTLTGSVLDAHPNVIIANEYGIAEKFFTFKRQQQNRKYIFNKLLNKSIKEVEEGQRSPNFNGLFNYHVASQWQGKYNCSIEVIGDKWSVGTARQFIKLKPEKIEEFARVLKVPIKFIHVYRNPFDNIATMTLREANQRFNAEKSGYKPYNNENILKRKAHQYLKRVKHVETLRAKYSNDVLDIDYSEMLKNPENVVRKMCRFLDLHCSQDYIESCRRKMFKSETRTRLKIVWPERLKLSIAQVIRRVSPYRKFSFD